MSVALLLSENPDNLLGYFAAIAHLPFAMLLDSAAPHHPNSRFDILVADPKVTLEANGRACRVTVAAEEQQLDADPFTLLQQLQLQHLPTLSTEITHLPFVGGALGYVGYDAGRVIEKIPEMAQRDIALPDLVFGLYTWALVLDKQHKQCWYVDCEGATAQKWQQREHWLRCQMSTIQADFALLGPWQPQVTAQQYFDSFAQIQQYLHSGDCYQINLTQRFSAPYQGSEWQAYCLLRQTNAAPFSAFLNLRQGKVISISPERFLELKHRQVETKPIKGTLPRQNDPTLDQNTALALQNSVKNRAENVMIVDLLRNDLGKVCKAGSVRVPALFEIESFPAVHHLVSTVTGELEDHFQATDLLRAAFPGGSITGAPKIRAMEIIESLEPSRRSVYCGTIGYISQHGHMDTNIAIRTLVLSEQHIYCWAGGGIVADSEPEAEYQETFDKVAKILPILSQMRGSS